MKLRGTINKFELTNIQRLLAILVTKGKRKPLGEGEFSTVMTYNTDIEHSKEEILHMIGDIQSIIDQGKPD